jgi:hypothetical protein
MYDFMKSQDIPVDKKERKLTQLLNTNDEYMVFSNYYLWFLMDRYYFVIDDIEICYIFQKSTPFKGFAERMMRKRLETPESSEFYKLLMNALYGSTIKNQEKYSHPTIFDRNGAEIKKISDQFRNLRELNADVYQEILLKKITKEISKKAHNARNKEFIFCEDDNTRKTVIKRLT